MFGQRLKSLRKTRKLSMQEMADELGLARSTYAGYESGYREPNLSSLRIMAHKLQTSVDYLLGLTDDPIPREPVRDARLLLACQRLHWDGIPLEEEDLELVRRLLERVIRDRTPAFYRRGEKMIQKHYEQ
jgi:transcriptional regulator with XRE-family HTH domain